MTRETTTEIKVTVYVEQTDRGNEHTIYLGCGKDAGIIGIDITQLIDYETTKKLIQECIEENKTNES